MESAKKTGLFRSGAGVIAALVIILLFVLTALYLKSLIFGIIAAYFFLPLEKFFERRVFRSAAVHRAGARIARLFFPLTALRRKLSRSTCVPDAAEERRAKREAVVLRSTTAMFVTLAGALVLIGLLSVRLIIPAAINAGRAVNEWASESKTLKQAEIRFSGWMEEHSSAPAMAQTETESDFSFRDFLRRLRPQVRAYVTENRSDVALFAFTKGKGILSALFGIASRIGTFAFDLLLFFFFFFFFVLKMASFDADEEKSDVGKWCVQTIFNSPWMPDTSDRVRKEAAEIINSIGLMFNRWVRGYLSIILIETALYTILFSVFSVPYAIPLAVVAGMTILLPFIGPVASFALTFSICLAFCETHLLVTLIGVGVTYLLINGVLEQLFLYPTLVGGAIGLTTLETIIVVLLGGLLGGITGMILAVPAAAVLKYLIPKIYRIRIS